MDNFGFLQKYQKLQSGIMFDGIINLDFASIGYCEIDKSPFWNFALAGKNLSNKEIADIEHKFTSLSRSSTIYFENNVELGPLKTLLIENGYQKEFEDSWMFWEDKNIDEAHFDKIKKVETENDLLIFLKTFDACFRNDDPQNPYGELGDYLKVAENVWRRHHESNKLEYFIAYKDNAPVAVSTLTNFEGIGYISNVGSLKKVRGEGFGKAITLYCIAQSKKNRNSIHCIATEENTFPNDFYKQIGFKTLFAAVGYTKKQ